MSGASQPGATLLIGGGVILDAVEARLRADGRTVVRLTGLGTADVATSLGAIASLASVVIATRPPALGTPFLDVSDDQLEIALGDFLDLFGALGLAIPRLETGGAIVGIGSRGHLGAWGGAHDMAFAGSLAGLFRSSALETMDRGLRANLIAVELPASGKPSDPEAVADLAAYLLSPAAAAVNGELILANGGRSLRIREARDRRAPRLVAVT